jgi:hypothetical protein
MSGTFTLDADPDTERFFSFSIKVVAPSLREYLRDFGAEMHGTLEAEGFAEGVPVEGTMLLSPLIRRLIRYELRFVADDGEAYRFEGQKNIRFTSLRRTFTELPGTLYDADGRRIGTAHTRFDVGRDLLPFVASWRPA